MSQWFPPDITGKAKEKNVDRDTYDEKQKVFKNYTWMKLREKFFLTMIYILYREKI